MSGRDGADRFLPLAIEIVKQAIELDEQGKFKEAFYKYKEALQRFMTVRATIGLWGTRAPARVFVGARVCAVWMFVGRLPWRCVLQECVCGWPSRWCVLPDRLAGVDWRGEVTHARTPRGAQEGFK
jgi:hypothetical protein